eukprot:TRINITY_DN84307_c0_g1_i1.p1 TRINITY_DN84307_c0_g1~~TRINITY_DN84307_c0_g1_i1.p1  ORF type:complete len:227 (-),score=26.55 TRINITY_DN84307_c0_g1_i1:734-1342(-)
MIPFENHLGSLPVFTTKRPLREGDLRKLSLFEPHFLKMFDRLADAGRCAPGLELITVHARHGSERPIRYLPQVPGDEPALVVEVDAVLAGESRVACVESIKEASGEDGLRRWRLEVRGTSRTLKTRCLSLVSDEFGALWSELLNATETDPSEEAIPMQEEMDGGSRRPVRCVAVVGLNHVNGMVDSLARSLSERVVRDNEER